MSRNDGERDFNVARGTHNYADLVWLSHGSVPLLKMVELEHAGPKNGVWWTTHGEHTSVVVCLYVFKLICHGPLLLAPGEKGVCRFRADAVRMLRKEK